MRLIEIRLYEGPNVYRLLPVVKVEVAVGRTRAWQGSRSPTDGTLVHLGRSVPARDWPDAVLFDLLDSSLSRDLTAAGSLRPEMIKRFLALGRYADASRRTGGRS